MKDEYSDNYSYQFRNQSRYSHADQAEDDLDEDLFNFNNHPRYETFLNLLCDLKPRNRAIPKR